MYFRRVMGPSGWAPMARVSIGDPSGRVTHLLSPRDLTNNFIRFFWKRQTAVSGSGPTKGLPEFLPMANMPTTMSLTAWHSSAFAISFRTAGSVQEATDLFERCAPDLVLMDLRLPDGNGVQAIHRMRSKQPTIKTSSIQNWFDTYQANGGKWDACGFQAMLHRRPS